MISKGKISDVLTALSRYGLSQNGLDSQCRMLQQILNSLRPTDKYDHRTAVLIHAGLKCLDQRDWLQIQCGDLNAQISHLIAEAYGTDSDDHREKLLVEILAQVKLIAQAQIIGNELYVRASEYVLQANTFILSRLTGDRELQEYVAPPEGIIADQLQGLRALVDSIIGDLAGASRFVNGPWFVQEDDSFESKVQARALTVIVAFAEKAAAYAGGNHAQAMVTGLRYDRRHHGQCLQQHGKQWLYGLRQYLSAGKPRPGWTCPGPRTWTCRCSP